jgi:hypothetical protein
MRRILRLDAAMSGSQQRAGHRDAANIVVLKEWTMSSFTVPDRDDLERTLAP